MLAVDSDPARLDMDVIHDFLTHCYWSKGISRELVERAVRNSLCFGVYDGDRQVGFARLVTDQATFAYLADVFILESHRGRGLSRKLVAAITSDPRLKGLRRWLLATRDAHGLYAQFGFTPLAKPERFMELHDPDVYAAGLNPR
jgi:N-acetylglutamate synthase-like GNAT family acetyltransferase